jgi:glycosyltransferase involved in cell wall biosynthesis
MLLTVSNLYFEKGHGFVLKPFRKLGVEDAALVIIGEKPYRHGWYNCYPLRVLTRFLNAKVKVLTQIPRQWVVSAYKEADLFLFGSEFGCAPLVMYETFASSTLFVTRDVGNVRDHKEVVKIVRTPDGMAAVARELLRSKSERASLSGRAYELWSRLHTWETIVDQYETLYDSLL